MCHTPFITIKFNTCMYIHIIHIDTVFPGDSLSDFPYYAEELWLLFGFPECGVCISYPICFGAFFLKNRGVLLKNI